MTGGDDRWWKWWWFYFREHLFTKANANPNPGKMNHSVASQNSYSIDKFVLRSCPMGGGVATESEGSSQVWMLSQTAMGSTVPNHFVYQSGFPKCISDWMQWLSSERAYTAIQEFLNSSHFLDYILNIYGSQSPYLPQNPTPSRRPRFSINLFFARELQCPFFCTSSCNSRSQMKSSAGTANKNQSTAAHLYR